MIAGRTSRLLSIAGVFAVAGVIFALLPPLRANWVLVSETAKVEIQPGVWQVTKKAKTGAGEMELSLVFFDDRKTRTCVAAQKSTVQAKNESLAKLASDSRAIAGCNGGYFAPRAGLPSGLEIAQGVRTGTWQNNLPFGGVFGARQGVPMLLPDGKFVEDGAITDLVQCCPMLVQEGKALREIGGKDLVARTFVATDGAHGWVIGFSPRASLEDLAEVLATPGVLHEFRVQSAMNLDGGPSSGLWWKPAQGDAQGVRSTTMVRNVILVLPK